MAREQTLRIERGAGRRSRRRGDDTNIEIELPTLHIDQLRAYRQPGRFKAVRCGRRWGKTLLGETIAANGAARGEFVGWFSPEYKFQSEAYSDIADMLAPAIWSSSKVEGVMRTRSGGRIDFWTLDNPRAGRSRRYHKVIIDEAAFTKPIMMDTWRKAIRPTLVDFRGSALALSNTNGIDPENFFYQICNDPDMDFVQYHAPTSANPYMPAEEIEEIKAKTHPLVFEQEYEAEFVDWSGHAFFAASSLLTDGRPVEYPTICDGVFATIDTAVKDHAKHDGTGVVYWAVSKHFGQKLIILDYDLIQMEGSLLEVWLPGIYKRLMDLAEVCRARFGALGAWIEDKTSGTILLQQAKRRGWPAHPIDSKLTSLGKDARCINVSGYVTSGDVKLSLTAYDKIINYKGTSRNHLLGQVVGYRVGVDQGEDDLLDCFAYGIAVALGDYQGF
jgi:hypothetical protein